MIKRTTFKVRLTTKEAEAILDMVERSHDENTEALVGDRGFYSRHPEERDAVKEESVALRRVRDALKRQLS